MNTYVDTIRQTFPSKLTIFATTGAILGLGTSYYFNRNISTKAPLTETTPTHNSIIPFDISKNKPKKPISHLNTLESHPKTTVSDFSEKQIACAERLGVDPKECNQHGVFTERSPQVKDGLLHLLPSNSWDEVTPKMLKNIGSLNLQKKNITSLKKQDFDGLLRLLLLFLDSNLLTTLPNGIFENLPMLDMVFLNENKLSHIPVGIFDNLRKLKWLFLNENQLKTLPNNMIKNLNNLSLLLLYDNPLIISETLFRNFQKNIANLAIGYHITANESNYKETDSEYNLMVATPNAPIQLSEISHLFQTFKETGIDYFFPNKTKLPKYHIFLTPHQEAFLCNYLQLDLNKTPSETSQRQLKICQKKYPSQSKNHENNTSATTTMLISIITIALCTTIASSLD